MNPMAEYKTYVCDICEEHHAQRFTFPYVDRETRRIAEQSTKELEIPGSVDLCPRHFQRVFDYLIMLLPNMEDQRRAWKSILGLES